MNAMEVTEFFAHYCHNQRIELTSGQINHALTLIDNDPEFWAHRDCWDLVIIAKRDS